MLTLPPTVATAATTTIFAAAAIIWFSIAVSAQATAPAPFSGMEPSSSVPESYMPSAAPAPFSGMEPSSSVPESYMPLAPGPAATVTNDCMTPLLNMTDCLTYVEATSNLTVPDKNCCPELAGLVDGNPICLCELLSNSSLTESYGIKIDISRALKLPSLCRVNTPPVSMCSAVGYPVAGPTPSQVPMSPSSLFPGVPPPGALASSPSAGDNGSGASDIAGSAHVFFVGLAFSFLLTLV